MADPVENLTIESVSDKVQSTKKRLDELKVEISKMSSVEKVGKAQELADLKTAISESRKELEELKLKFTEDADKTKLEKIALDIDGIEAAHKQLDAEISKELSNLSQDVQVQDSEKWWLATQWEWLTSKDEWKDHTWKNIVRALGWVWLVWWVVWIWKKIFGRKDYEDEIEWYDQMTRQEKKKARKEWKRKKRLERKAERKEIRKERKKERAKKPFWKRPIWKIVKWTWIWTVVYYFAHGISTWRRSLKDIFRWKKAGLLSDIKTNREEYLKEKKENPEKYAKYEEFWEKVNDMYDYIWATEKEYFGYESDFYLWALGDNAEKELNEGEKGKKVEHEETKWMVPWLMDDYFSNVDDILSHWWVEKYMCAKTIEGYKQKIKELWAKWFAKVLLPLFTIPKAFGINSSDDDETKMNKFLDWISTDKDKYLRELNMIFRQYLKVVVYLADKKNAIALKVAEDSLISEGKLPANESDKRKALLDKLDDDDWVETVLEKDPTYTRFLNSRLHWLKDALWEDYDSEPTFMLQNVVSEVDAGTEKILWWNAEDNKLKRVEDKIQAGTPLDAVDKKWLWEVVEGIREDIDLTNKKSFCYVAFERWANAFGAEEADKHKILNESWLGKMFAEIRNNLEIFKNEVETNPTPENVQKLKDAVWRWAATKKELNVSIYALQKARENKNALDVIIAMASAYGLTFRDWLVALHDIIFEWKLTLKNVVKVWVAVAQGGVTYLVFTKKGWKYTWRATTTTLRWPKMAAYGLWGHLWSSWAKRRLIFNISKTNRVKAENLLKLGILDWSLSAQDVENIAAENEKLVARSRYWKNYRFHCLEWVSEVNKIEAVVKKGLFGRELTANEVKLFFKYREYWIWPVTWGRIRDVSRSFTILNTEQEFFNQLKSFDGKFGALSPQNQEILGKLLGNVRSTSDLSILTELSKRDGQFLRNLNSLLYGKSYVPKELAEYVSDVFKKVEISGIESRVNLMCNTIDEINGLSKSGRVPEQTVKRLSKLFKMIPDLGTDEVRVFWWCVKNWFKLTHMLDLVDLVKIEKIWGFSGAELKKLMWNGDLDGICRYLNDHINDLKKVKLNNTTDKLVEWLSRLKKAEKAGKGLLKWVEKGMPKLLKFLMKAL